MNRPLLYLFLALSFSFQVQSLESKSHQGKSITEGSSTLVENISFDEKHKELSLDPGLVVKNPANLKFILVSQTINPPARFHRLSKSDLKIPFATGPPLV